MALKILLADDSMIAQNLGKKILTDAGYEVVAVSNGAAAVKKIAEVKPDIAILDIYMPGYTGLEVCERIKNNLETSRTPVLLTVGKMEPYRPEDGAKVKADGVIIKPFEGSDLTAAVGKLAEKLTAASKAVAYEETVVLTRAQIEEFKDASYEEWKTSSDDEAAPAAQAVPAQDLSAMPAFGMEELPVDAPAQAMAASASASSMPAFSAAVPGEFIAGVASVVPEEVDETVEAAPIDPFAPTDTQPIEPLMSEPEPIVAPEPVMPAAPVAIAETPEVHEFEPTAAPEISLDMAAAAPAPEIEFTSAPQVEVHAPTTAELEPTIFHEETTAAPSFDIDPALVTDASEMATAFPTRFGVENPEEIPVGVFTEETAVATEPPAEEVAGVVELPVSEEEASIIMPSLEEPASPEPATFATEAVVMDVPVEEFAAVPMVEAPVEEAAQPWQAQEAVVESHEEAVLLEAEMDHAFSALEEKAEPPAPVVEPPAEPELSVTQEVAATAPGFADVPVFAEEPIMDTAPAPAISGDPEFAAAMEAALASLSAEEASVPETVIEVPMAAATALPAPVAEVAEPEPTVEAAVAVTEEKVSPEEELLLAPEPVAGPVLTAEPEPLSEIENEVMRRAAVIGPAAAVVSTAVAPGARLSETRVATAIERVLERMKTQIVAEVMKELGSE